MNTLNTGCTLKNGVYKIVRTLGQGSFGITYLASARTTIAGALGKMDVEVNVAIKEFFMSDLNSRSADGTSVEKTDSSLVKNYRTKFRREADNLSKLQHPNIVKVKEVFEENNTTYYAMQYIDGLCLDDYITNQGSLSENKAISILREVGTAVQYMHSNNMLHLDLKPKNIMLDKNGKSYLIDFGLSKQYDDNGEPESSTKVGAGTPGYAPLEQANYREGKGFPVTMDIYALGATLFKMLTGIRPPEASDLLNDGFPFSELRKHNVSAKVISSIVKAMAPAKKDRFQTIKDFLNSFDMVTTDSEATVIDASVQNKREKKTTESAKTLKTASPDVSVRSSSYKLKDPMWPYWVVPFILDIAIFNGKNAEEYFVPFILVLLILYGIAFAIRYIRNKDRI